MADSDEGAEKGERDTATFSSCTTSVIVSSTLGCPYVL